MALTRYGPGAGTGSGAFVPDAPLDGTLYGRKDGAWEAAAEAVATANALAALQSGKLNNTTDTLTGDLTVTGNMSAGGNIATGASYLTPSWMVSPFFVATAGGTTSYLDVYGTNIRTAAAGGAWSRGLVTSEDSVGALTAGAGFKGTNNTIDTYHIGFGADWSGADSKFSVASTGTTNAPTFVAGGLQVTNGSQNISYVYTGLGAWERGRTIQGISAGTAIAGYGVTGSDETPADFRVGFGSDWYNTGTKFSVDTGGNTVADGDLAIGGATTPVDLATDIYRAVGVGDERNQIYGAAGAAGFVLATNQYIDKNDYQFKYTTGSSQPASRMQLGSTSFSVTMFPNGDAGDPVGTGKAVLQAYADRPVLLQGGTLATGTGIGFPPTQAPSSDPNTLDDYVEGSWTPATTTSNLTVSAIHNAQYVKIGRLVTAWCYIAITNAGGATNGLRITGLPFNSNTYGEAHCYYAGTGATNPAVVFSYVQDANNYAEFNFVANAIPNSVSNFMFRFTYPATA